MEEARIRRERHQRFIDLVRLERGAALVILFSAHRHPDVGVNDVRPFDRLLRIGELANVRHAAEAVTRGLAMVNSAPTSAHASASERETLLPSPMKAIFAPSILPSSCLAVSRSASA